MTQKEIKGYTFIVFIFFRVTFHTKLRLITCMEKINEKQLIKNILDGQTQHFGYFLNTYSSFVYSLISQLVPNPEDAEELTEDTFIKAFDTLRYFQGKSKFSTWLFRIAYNKAISFTRKKKILFEDKQLDNVSIAEADHLLFVEDSTEKVKKLQQCITLLKDEEKALIHLFYYQKYELKEIAEILDIATSTVKVRLFRIRKKLYLMMKNKTNS